MPGWTEQIKELGHDLISIEINTIEAEGMVGRKMPSYPHALIDLAQKYGDYLGAEPIRLNLDAFATTFAKLFVGSGTVEEALRLVTNPQTKPLTKTSISVGGMRDAPISFTVGPFQYSFSMTNGPNTFEMLRWAARRVLDAAEKGAREKRGKAGPDEESDDILPSLRLPPRVIAIVRRIYRTSDQIKTVCSQLSKQAEQTPYIGKTRFELMAMEQPDKMAPPEYLSRIRKAWDIGVDDIVLQTVIQLDGDVIFRGSPDVLNGGGPLLKAHEAVTAVGLQHWQHLFNIVIDLLSRGLDSIFGQEPKKPETDAGKPGSNL